MDCPKCGMKNGIFGSYEYLDKRNKCWSCGTSHVPGIHRDSLDKQVTGETVFRYQELYAGKKVMGDI